MGKTNIEQREGALKSWKSSVGRFVPEKLDAFDDIYTLEVLDRIAKACQHNEGSRCLYNRLTHAHPSWQAFRIYFNKWLNFAKEKDGLDKDRLTRLTRSDIFAWQQAVSEIEVAYFFAKAFGLEITFVTDAKKKGEGDFSIDYKKQAIRVEVKTPKDPKYAPWESLRGAEFGSGETLVRKSFLEAARQMQRGNVNLVAICTMLCRWIRVPEAFSGSLQGHDMITRDVSPETGRAVGSVYTTFEPDGKFNKRSRPDSGPRHRRISAVAYFDEHNFSEEEQRFRFAVFHNYHALNPLESSLFPNTEQWVPNRQLGTIEPGDEKKRVITIRDS